MFDNTEIDYAETQFETLAAKAAIESELSVILGSSYNLKLIFKTKSGTSIYTFKYSDIDYLTLKKIEEYLLSIIV